MDADAEGDVQDVDPDEPGPPAPVRPRFLWEGPWEGADTFYAFPIPSDWRRREGAAVDWAGMPYPASRRTVARLVEGLVETAGQLTGFPRVSVAYFGFDGALAPRSADQVIPADLDAPFWLINVDADSPEWGRLYPLVATTLLEDAYVPHPVLALAPRPGLVLRPNTTYAYVVRATALDVAGRLLAPAEEWLRLSEGDAPAALAAMYVPLAETLAEIDAGTEDIVAATVFTTGDEVAELYRISEALRAAHEAVIGDLAVDPTDGASHEHFCELHGVIAMPQFQEGTPPFNEAGLFVMDSQGVPTLQRTEELPIVVSLPLGEMPEEGFPLVLYFHGSGGLSTQVVDRGPRPGPGQPSAIGKGPADVLAQRGFASVGAALPVNPERLPGAGSTEYLNLNNLKAFRDTFRQGAIEQRLLLDALLALRIAPTQTAACAALTLPEGADAFFFREDPVQAMGQSMGGMYTNMIAAVEPRIQAVVPTGAGGYWSYFILETGLIPGVATLLRQLLGTPHPLTFLHPVLGLLQTGWEAAEPMAYTGRLAVMPLDGHPVRPIYQPAGEGDSYFPTQVFDAMALAYAHHQAGAPVWGSMQDALRLIGMDGLLPYPVANNTSSEAGSAYTGVVVQYAGDGFTDPHDIFVELEEVRYQYGCFFWTHLHEGTATVLAPRPMADPCAPLP